MPSSIRGAPSWKLISDPPARILRSLRTVGEEGAIIGVIIGEKKPEIPFYPPTSEICGERCIRTCELP